MQFSFLQSALLTININFVVLAVYLLWIRPGSRLSAKIMGLLLLVSAYVNTHFVFLYNKPVYLNFPHLLGTHAPFLIALPVLLFLLYRASFEPDFRLKGRQWLHLTTPLLMLAIYIPFYASGLAVKTDHITAGTCYISYGFLPVSFFLTFSVYMGWVVVDIRKKLQQKDLDPVLANVLGFARLLAISLLVVLVAIVGTKSSFIYIPIITSLIYYFMVVQMLRHPRTYLMYEDASRKYRNNELDEGYVETMYEEIVSLIREERLYLDNRVSMSKLAEKVELPSHHISQIINRTSGLNFNDFINRFRADHCKKLLLSGEYGHYTVEALGKFSGFNSRQTLIKSFKKFYQLTPSELLKSERVA